MSKAAIGDTILVYDTNNHFDLYEVVYTDTIIVIAELRPDVPSDELASIAIRHTDLQFDFRAPYRAYWRFMKGNTDDR